MDLVQDFQAAFELAKQQPEKSMDGLLAVIKQHAQNINNSETWRWDVMRAVVGDDLEYVKLVTTTQLIMSYEQQRKLLEKEPVIINMTAMLLHAHYGKYHQLVDVVSLQKSVFGEELFSKIEDQTISFLDKLLTKTLTSENVFDMSAQEYANYLYKDYAVEYEQYYYWPHMKASMDKAIASIS